MDGRALDQDTPQSSAWGAALEHLKAADAPAVAPSRRVGSDPTKQHALCGGKGDWSPDSCAPTSAGSSPAAASYDAEITASPFRSEVPSPLGDAPARRLTFDDVEAEGPRRPLLRPTAAADERVYWESFLVIAPLFGGYSALFGLQHKVKSMLEISDDASAASYGFSCAVSLLYWFIPVFRMVNGVAFGFLKPRQRVFLSMMFMTVAMLALVALTTASKSSGLGIGWVIFAYSLGGAAVGTFESNFLSYLTQFGHQTKHAAILGIPVGVNAVLVGGFFVMGPPMEVPVTVVYACVAFALLCGIGVLGLRIPSSAAKCPPGPAPAVGHGVRKIAADLRQWRLWLPQCWHIPLASAIDMCAIAAFAPGAALYVFDHGSVSVAGLTMPTDSFFTVADTASMLGGTTGRYLSYHLKLRHPLFYSILTLAGVAVSMLWEPTLFPLGTFLILLGNGLIYGSISRHIDACMPQEFNLTAISLWLLIGDTGSVLGSNLINLISVSAASR